MGSNVRFIGFTNDSLRDKVNVEGKDMIQLECFFNTDIFSLLLKLGAEVRFKTNSDLDYVVDAVKPSSISICASDSDGKQHFDTTIYSNDTNLSLIIDRDRVAITGASGFISALTEVLSRYAVAQTWTICLEDVPVVFGKMSMEEALLNSAGVFSPKPKRIKCKTSIKIPDGKTPWDELPPIPCYLNSEGYVVTRFDSLPAHIKQCFYDEEK